MIILRDQINIRLNINSYALAPLNFEIIKEIKVLFDSKLYGDLEFTFPILSKTKKSEKELDLFSLNKYYTEALYKAFKMMLKNLSSESVIYTNYFKY